MKSNDIYKSLSLLIEPGAVAELRVPSTPKGTVSGYFDDPRLLSDAAAALSGKAPGVYVTLNRVRPDLLARAANKTIPYAKHTTGDADIVRRCWLPIDFDPVRPAGISSTDAEHQAALELAEKCREWLGSQGWPSPIFADSGNGAHLLYKIDLNNDSGTTAQVKQALQALSLRFSNDKVHVDTTTSNAARIWKVYGTLAAKGDNTADRPYRMAEILKFPDHIEIAASALIAALGTKIPEGKKQTRRSIFDVERWLEDHGIDFAPSAEWKDGRKWVLNPCPWNSDHTNGSAYIVQFPGGAIAAGCHHDSCSDNDWPELKKLFDSPEDTKTKSEKQSQVDSLLELGAEAQLFHSPDGDVYATIVENGHSETWSVRSKSFRQWLMHRYFSETEGAPNSQALQEAIATFESRGSFAGPEIPVFVRVAESNGKIYIDLGNDEWNAVEIDEHGWRIVSDPPVKFQRARGMKQLPTPTSGGSIEALRPFVNVGNEADWKLIVAWLVASLRPTGPFPALVFNGEQGSAKSTTAKVLRELTDPNTAGLRAEPKDVRDIMIAARNGWVISLDNMSHVPGWLSDAICRLATGGAFATRQLYENTEEVLIDAQRPVMLNGIEELTTRSDLLDRSVILTLPSIREDKRQSEKEFWANFRTAQPGILGGLLDAVACAMRCIPQTKLSALPRMADFALWVTAAEPALGWGNGSFMEAYTGNRASANDLALDASPLSSALRSLVSEHPWEGTATDLLRSLALLVGDQVTKQKGWPTSARALSNALRRLRPNLRATGIEIGFDRETSQSRRRIISITVIGGTNPSAKETNPICPATLSGEASIQHVMNAADDSDARFLGVEDLPNLVVQI